MTERKPCILCVDDEPANVKLLEALLTPYGYEVVKAENGKEAIEKIADGKIDLVLLDIMLPQINGFDICQMIKQEEKFRHLPIILVTALRSSKDRIRGIEAGADDFISKPFDQSEILARIKMLLKVKNLNERLSSAYSNINNLISYGEKIMKYFDPLHFNLEPALDHLVTMNIREVEDMIDKPEIIIIGFSNRTKQFQWFRYQHLSGELKKSSIEYGFKNAFGSQHQSHPKIVYANMGDIGISESCPFLEELESRGLSISNAVCYLSNELVILALNYGRDVTTFDAEVLNSLVVQSMFMRSLSDQVRETEDAFSYTVHALARAAEVNDEDTGNHIIRVGEFCTVIGKHSGMSQEFCDIIRVQAQMHDIGKIHTPAEILRKPRKLTPEEFEEIKKHTIYGSKILGDHVRFTMAREIALSHHERWDGGGYPYGLKGEQIPLPARILSIADQYDALRNARVYKPAFDHQKTYHIITEGDGRTMPSHFDPELLRIFRDASSQFEEIYERIKG